MNIEARRFDFEHHSEELVVSTRAIFVKIDSEGNPDPIDPDIREKYQKK